jgi:CheY-like chemotaxis protein
MARILLAEDDNEVRVVVVDMIALAGHAVTAARNGDAALPLLQQEEFDLLITDVRMPGKLNGFTLAKTARVLHPSIKIICMTGYTDAVETPGTCDDFLRKPFSTNILKPALERLLSR